MEGEVMTKAVVFFDGRCHATFDDGTGVILHSGAQFCTYFKKNGESQRMLTACSTGKAKDKVISTLEFYNSVALKPTTILGEAMGEVVKKEHKITQLYFSAPGVVSVVDDQAHQVLRQYSLTDDDKECILIKDAQGSYTIHSPDNEASVTLSPNGLLFRVCYPLLLPHRKPIMTEISKKKTMKLFYEYITVSQVFSTANYPDQWEPILSILYSAYLADNRENIRSPQSYNTQPTIQAGEFIIPLIFSTQGDIWKDDSISPSVQFLNYYSSPIHTVWTPQATFYCISKEDIEVLVHIDHTILIVYNHIYKHYRDGQVFSFTSDSVSPIIRTPTHQYLLTEVVEICGKIQANPWENTPQIKEPLDEDFDAEGVKLENVIEGVGLFTAYNDRSVRVLFDDRIVIRIYRDMTATAIDRKGQIIKLNLTNPYGFETYVPICMEFYSFVFTSNMQKKEMQEEMIHRENVVKTEINCIHRLISTEIPEVNEAPPVSSEIEGCLSSTAKQIEEINRLLTTLPNKYSK